MKRLRLLQYAASGIAGLGFVVPSGVMAAQPNVAPVVPQGAQSPVVVDVALGEGGRLVGQVVSSQGAPLPQTAVTVRSAGAEVTNTVTDAQGSFSIAGLKGGIQEINAAGGTSAVRLWTASASPPSANRAVLIVAGDGVARGQMFKGPNKLGSIALFGVIVGGTVTAGVIAAGLNKSSS